MTDPAHAADLLTSTVSDLSTAQDVETITGIVASAVRQLMGSEGATFVLREDDKCYYVDEDAISPMWKGQKFPLTACISGWSMLNRQVVKIRDIYQDNRIPHDAYRPTFVKSLTMAPIRKSDPIGALGAYWKDEHTPDDEEVRLLEVLANSAAVALENLELRATVTRRSDERDDLAVRRDELETSIHTLAHDLRSPLGAMMGYAELLMDEITDDPERALVFAQSICDSAVRMSEQIDRMLALYRITTQPIEAKVVNLTEIGRNLAGALLGKASGRQLEVSIEDDLHAEADPVLARLVLENLIDNAVKYTGRKERARVEVGRVEESGGFTTFYVKDNGDGFDGDAAGELFRPMKRLHTQAEFPGTGLGLASVARIVERHGGRIRAEGEKGVGAAFYFSLPSADLPVAS